MTKVCKNGLFNALNEPGHSDNLLSKAEKLYLGNSNIAIALSEDGIIDVQIRERPQRFGPLVR